MYASECLVGKIVYYYGDLYQVIGRPGKFKPGYVEAVNERGMLELIDYTRCHTVTYERLYEDKKEGKLKWFFIPKSLLRVN